MNRKILESIDTGDLNDLDPCCRQEIEARKKLDVVNAKLSKNDRSNYRIKINERVFGDTKFDNCTLCSENRDYYSLGKLRISLRPLKCSSDPAFDIDSDSDLDDDDNYVSEYEKRRKLELDCNHSRIALAKDIGFGKHVEESPEHLLQLGSGMQSIVCHVYDPASFLSASIDLFFESMSVKYLGTLFRRIDLKHVQNIESKLTILSNYKQISHNVRSRVPFIMCLRKNNIIGVLSNLREFGDEKYLNRSYLELSLQKIPEVLEDQLAFERKQLMLLENRYVDNSMIQGDARYNPDDSGEAPGHSNRGGGLGSNFMSRNGHKDGESLYSFSSSCSSYCGMRACGRSYPHSHIGSERDTGYGYEQRSPKRHSSCSDGGDGKDSDIKESLGEYRTNGRDDDYCGRCVDADDTRVDRSSDIGSLIPNNDRNCDEVLGRNYFYKV